LLLALIGSRATVEVVSAASRAIRIRRIRALRQCAWLFNHERCALQYQVGNRNMHYRFSLDTAFKMILPVRWRTCLRPCLKTLTRLPNRHKGDDRVAQQ
jgi:hypothetical protein